MDDTMTWLMVFILLLAGKKQQQQKRQIVGLNKIYSFIVIISSINKYRKHKGSMLIGVLPIDKIIITYTFTMARWQIVVKMSEATKQRPKQQQTSYCY